MDELPNTAEDITATSASSPPTRTRAVWSAGSSAVWPIGRRLLGSVAVLLLVTFLTFSLVHLAPGSPESALVGDGRQTPEVQAAIREQYGLNRPFLAQYADWLKDAARLDFNVSPRTREPVTEAIQQRWGDSAFLAAYAFLLTFAIAVPLGVLSALRQRTATDRAVSIGGLVGLCAPPFAVGILLLYVFAVTLHLFPTAGAGSGFVDRLHHLTLPAVALAIASTAWIARVTRAAMIVELDQDYVVFARARGLSRRRVVIAHALRNALMPVVTMGGFLFASLITGALLVEIVFSLPGLGLLFLQSIDSKDIPMIQGMTLLFATLIIVINLIVDLLYLLINPRVRIQGSRS